MTLTIASNLHLPDDMVTQASAILARRGAGKTYAGSVIAEEMIKEHLPVVVIDPMGVWWGLRSAPSGAAGGLPVTILGGEHGDLPLEPTAGKVIADLAADEPAPMILDLSGFESNAAQDRFVTDFAERLYRAKATRRDPLHLMVDEADSFAPQRPAPGQQRMLGAWEAIVRRGRSRGLGVTLISQRPASVNKNVLTQIECLIVMQVTGPQDRSAIKDWISGNADADEGREVLASLASLTQGQAWIWSPSWLQMLRRVKIRARRTFDSSATPKAGTTPRGETRFAKVDLARLESAMAATIERAEANDPKLLRKRIAELERKLSEQPVTEVRTEYVEVPFVDQAVVDRLWDVKTALGDAMPEVSRLISQIERVQIESSVATKRQLEPAVKKTQPRPARPSPPPPASDDEVKLKAGERRILDVLGRQYPLRVTLGQLGTLAKFKTSGGTFKEYFAHLRREGLLSYDGNEITLTENGLAHSVGSDVRAAPMTHDEVMAMWRGALKGRQRDILDFVVGAHPREVSLDDVADHLGMVVTGGTFKEYVSTLRRNGLIEVGSGMIRASDTLWP